MAMRWYLHSCPVCGGDTHDDPDDRGWVTCFLCARSFSAKDVLPAKANRDNAGARRSSEGQASHRSAPRAG